MSGQIIIVNGTSGSGKSTACELYAKRSEQFWLLYGIDHFMASTFPSRFGHHGPRCREGIYAHPANAAEPEGALRWSFGEWGVKATQVMHEWIAAAARQGCNIIIDHLMTTDPPLLQDCIWRLREFPVLLVTLKPPYEVLMERIATRAMGSRFSSSSYSDEQLALIRDRLDRLRPWFYEAVYANDISDLEIDTVQFSPEQVCEQIDARLKAGPGTAFERLRQRHAPPD